jgi:hypothetical protein
MSLDGAAVRRYGKQIALPEIGSEGQERLLAAEVALVGADLTIATAARYLAAAGVGRFRLIGAGDVGSVIGAGVSRVDWPAGGAGWEAALRGCAVVVRSGLDEDALLRAAVRLAVPVVVVRAGAGLVDLIALREHGPCPHQELDGPVQAASAPAEDPAAAVLAGTLAASEALLIVAQPGAPPRARHLRLPLDGEEPASADLPWAPECFSCGGNGREVVL